MNEPMTGSTRTDASEQPGERTGGRASGQKDDTLFLLRVKQEMDRSCAVLDGATQSRLNSMRHAVLAQGPRKGLRLLGLRKPLLLPFGGLVTACVLVLAVLVQTPALPVAAPVEDLDLLTATEELDFYEEYDFYQWLATNDPGY